MDTTDSNVNRGIALAKEGLYTDALTVFDQNLAFTQSPVAMSYYALCLATAEGFHDKAVSMCLMAAEKEFYNPEIYLNLGRVFLIDGQKSIAMKSFRKGLGYDTTHDGIVEEIRRLGVRRDPVVSFLRRDNAVNRLLGLFTGRVA
ncbi:MAG: hypothetical protein IME99_06185 [Proteobacteria bacterium]|nr:hypothetical protein [Pseudomonadota bacterium]